MSQSTADFLYELKQKRSNWLASTRENNFGILRFLSDLYPDQAHFVFELLQNAEDACASRVRFELHQDRLKVTHNGKRLFNAKDVDSITNIGNSTKKDDVNQIGKFGIGFKAVFSYTKTPQIYSGPFSFEIRDLVCPSEIAELQKEQDETVFIFPFNSDSKSPEACFQEVKRVFDNLDHTALLFLEHTKAIEWVIAESNTGSVVRELLENFDPNLIKVSVTTTQTENTKKDLWFLRFQAPLPEHGRLMCGFALKLAFREGKQDEIIPNKPLSSQMKVVSVEGKLCIFFPAEKEETGLRFYINGPYAATVDRASIKHEHEDNRAIFNETIKLFIKSMDELKLRGFLSPDFLEILPNNDDPLKPFYKVLRDDVYRAMKLQRLIPTKDGDHAPAILLLRGPKTFIDVLSEEDIALLADEAKRQWAAGVMNNSRADKLLDSLEIPNWDNDRLLEIVNKKFDQYSVNDKALSWLRAKEDKWLIQFYRLLLNAAKQKNKESLIKSWKIIPGAYDKGDDEQIEVGSKMVFPSKEKQLIFIAIVKASLLDTASEMGGDNQLKLREFLNAAGVKEFDERAQIKDILPSFYRPDGLHADPPEEEHLNDMCCFVKWYQKHKDVTLFDNHYIFLAADRNPEEVNLYQGPECYLDNPILETNMHLIYEMVPNINNKRVLLWPGYEKISNFVDFAKACGVQWQLEISKQKLSKHKIKLYPYAYQFKTNKAKFTDTGINEDYYIDNLDQILARKHPDIAKLVWDTMSKAGPEVFYARYRPNQQYTTWHTKSLLVDMLAESVWIPGKDGKFYKPSAMTRENLHKDFLYDDRNGWLSAIDFEADARQETAAYKQKEANARAVGLPLKDIEDFKKLKEKDPKKYNKIVTAIKTSLEESVFPEKPVKNAERREQGIREKVRRAPETAYEIRDRSVRYTKGMIDPRTTLRELYTDDKGRMWCQLCHDEMPFQGRDGKDYFEAVSISQIQREVEEKCLALCPICAAKYEEFIRKEKDAEDHLIQKIQVEKGPTIPITLGKEEGSLRFVERHLADLKVVLDELSKNDGD